MLEIAVFLLSLSSPLSIQSLTITVLPRMQDNLTPDDIAYPRPIWQILDEALAGEFPFVHLQKLTLNVFYPLRREDWGVFDSLLEAENIRVRKYLPLISSCSGITLNLNTDPFDFTARTSPFCPNYLRPLSSMFIREIFS